MAIPRSAATGLARLNGKPQDLPELGATQRQAGGGALGRSQHRAAARPASYARRATGTHERVQEYTARAAIDGGFHADTEVRATRRAVAGVVIGRRIGVRVQHSTLPTGAAVRRTGRLVNAGLEAVAWVAEIRSAPWTGQVPGYQWLDPWQLRAGSPQPRSAWADGLPAGFSMRALWGGTPPLPPGHGLLLSPVQGRLPAGGCRWDELTRVSLDGGRSR